MAVCLDYQSVYSRRKPLALSLRFKVFAAAVLLIALVLKVWVKMEATEYGYQLAKERKRTVELDMERRELALQLSVLMRPDNLAAAAKERAGLMPLSAEQVKKLAYQ
jgi:hypothetical protein